MHHALSPWGLQRQDFNCLMGTIPSSSVRSNRSVLRVLIAAVITTIALVVPTLSSAAPTEHSYIVVLDDSANLRQTVAAEEQAGNDVTRSFGQLNSFVVKLTATEAAALRADDATLIVERNQPVRIFDEVATLTASNDAFAAATTISSSAGSIAGTTVGATREVGEPGHATCPEAYPYSPPYTDCNGSASIWYAWTAPANGTLTINTALSSFDTLLALYTGSAVDGLTRIADNDNFWGTGRSRVSASVTAGTTYNVAVDGYGTSTGTSTLRWSFVSTDPPTQPDAPTRVIAIPSHTSLVAVWAAPGSDGRSAILDYTATATLGGRTCTSATTTCTITGLTNGTSYTLTVVARNTLGLSPSSAASAAAIPTIVTGRNTPAPSWGIDRIDQTALPLDGSIILPATGAGVTTYIIDTGIRADHVEFGGRVTNGYTYFSDGVGSNDCNGHGTHVAGTVAGSTVGVAPSATLVPVRVLNCDGGGDTTSVLAGINWMIADHQSGVPAIANMSIGGGLSSSLNDAVADAVADGIVVVAAAGNGEVVAGVLRPADACRFSPASEPTAITVGATDSSDVRAYFSNYGPCVDVFAPGLDILSAWNTSATATTTISGTSMAAPHVAGAAAVLLSIGYTSANAATALTTLASLNLVSDAGADSPNRLLSLAGVSPIVPSAPTTEPTPAPTTEPTPAPTTEPTPAPVVAPATLTKLRVTFRQSRTNRTRGTYVVKGRVSHPGVLQVLLTARRTNAQRGARRVLPTSLSYPIAAGPFRITTPRAKRGMTVRLRFTPTDTTIDPIVSKPAVTRIVQGTQTRPPRRQALTRADAPHHP